MTGFENLIPLRRWLCWTVTRNGDQLQKTPVNPTGGFAACDNPSTWVDYATARAAVDASSFDSIGFALGKDVGLVVVDFDKVRASTTDPWPAWVLREVEELDSYTEISAS